MSLPSPLTPSETAPIESGPRVAPDQGLQLRVVDGPDYGMSCPLRGATVVGTSPQSSLVLTDSTVSRRHVLLLPGTQGIEVQDLDSKNGVFQGGARLMHGHVGVGAEIVVGRTVLRVDGPDVSEKPARLEARTALHGNSSATRQLRTDIARAGRHGGHVVVEGERGTGRARVARAIHEQAGSEEDSFVMMSASAIDRGGVMSRIEGVRGSVLLVDAGQLSPAGRRALLDELETGRLSVRLLVSTERFDEVFSGDRVSEELGRLLGAVRVRVPPLRERASDLPALVAMMLGELDHPELRIGPEELGAMQAHAWPGNLRELKTHLVGLIEKARMADREPNNRRNTSIVGADLPYKEAKARMIQGFERQYAQSLLERTGGNVSKAARLAGIDRVYLHRLIKKYGLET